MTKGRVSLTLSLLSLLLISSSVHAQVPGNATATGYPENAVIHGTEIESVQVTNGDLHVQIPIWSAKGRGIDTAGTIVYDNKEWFLSNHCYSSGICTDTVAAQPGSNMALTAHGPTDYNITYKGTVACSTSNPPTYLQSNVVLREPDGTKHHFIPDPVAYPGENPCGNTAATTLYADDGSGWKMQLDATLNILYAVSKNGTNVNLTPFSIEDSNGNKLTPGSPGTDTLGRSIYGGLTYVDSSGTQRSAIISSTTSVAVATHLCLFSEADQCTEQNTTWTVPASLTLPNGMQYSFTYYQSQGAEIASITLPTGGQISYTYGGWQVGGRPVFTRTVTSSGVSGQWKYTINGTTTTETNPDQNDTVYDCSAASDNSYPYISPCYPKVTQYYAGSSTSGSLIKTEVTDYSTLQLGGGLTNVIKVPIRLTTTWAQTNQVTKTETDWDTAGVTGGTTTWKNVLERREYDWGSGTPGALLRKTHYSYKHLENSSYLTANIADRPTSKIVYDGAGNIAAQTKYTIDGVLPTGSFTAPGHDATYTSSYNLRGNVTQTSVWRNTDGAWLNANYTYDILGNLLSAQDPLLHTTSYDYSDNSASACTPSPNSYAYLTTTTDALGHHIYNKYYYCNGLLQATKDDNDVQNSRAGTTYTYDSVNRRVDTYFPDSGHTHHQFNDPSQIVTTRTASPDPDIVTTTNLEGMGRIASVNVGGVQIDTGYDGFGRLYSQSNPHSSVGSATDGTTYYNYDPLSRLSSITRPDGAHALTSYSGNVTTVGDETGRQRKTTADGSGRVVEVDEPTDIYSSGQPYVAPTAGTGPVSVSGTLQSWQTQTAAATQATGYAVVGGALKSTPVVTQTAAAGTGYVTVSGSLQNVTITYQCGQNTWCQRTVPESGNVYVTVNGHTDTAAYGNSNTSTQLAALIAQNINADGAALVTASVSGSTVNLTAKTTGAGTNYSLSVSTDSVRGSGLPSLSYSLGKSGSSLTGGRDQITTTVYDSGTASITINGQAVSYGWSGSGTTPSSIAIGLSQALNASSSYVTSTYSGTTVYFTSKASGASTNYGLSSGSTWNATYFSPGSFSVSSSGGALTGGQDAQYTTNYDSGTTTVTVNGHPTTYNWSGSSTTASSVAMGVAQALNADGGTFVNASNSGATVNLTARATGSATNYSVSTSTTSSHSSFSSTGPGSLSGGSDGQAYVAPHQNWSFSPAYVAQYRYDALDDLTCVEQHGNVTGTGCSSPPSSDASSPWRVRRFTYDSLSHLITASNPESGTICYGTWSGSNCVNGYDAAGNLTYKTDARGITTTYLYDADHRVYQKNHSDGSNTLSYTYDSGSFGGITPSNPVHHLIHISNNVNAASTYSFDPVGRISSETNCIPSDCNDAHNPVAATYDLAGNLTKLTYPSGTVVNYQYNGNGWLNRAYPTSGSDYVNVGAFWPTGSWQTATYGNGLQESNTYNPRLQPNHLKLLRSGSPVEDKGYVWTGCSEGTSQAGYDNGNVCQITDGNPSYSQTFNYDVLNRIVSGTQSDGAINQSFTYDAWGNINMTGFSGGAGVPNSYTPSYTLKNQDGSLTYDASGNIQDMGTAQSPHQFQWDAEGRLTYSSGTANAYIYDADGNRIRKTVGSNWTEYIYFGGDIIAEKTSGGWADYIFAGDNRIYQTGTVPSQYYWADHLGSASVLSDTAGNTVQITHYAPFGPEVDAGGLTTHYKFTGKERDTETGLDYFGARYYGSNMGRWISPDWAAKPITVPYADFGNPQSLNLYQYVLNNPLSRSDDDGHEIIYANNLKNAQLVKDSVQAILADPHTSANLSGYVDKNNPDLIIKSGDLSGEDTKTVLPDGRTLTTTVQGNTEPDIQTSTITSNGVTSAPETILTGATITIDNRTSKDDTPDVLVHESVHAGEAKADPAKFRQDAAAEKTLHHDQRPQEQRAIAAQKAYGNEIKKSAKKIEKDRKKKGN